jgi:hypothetical protein
LFAPFRDSCPDTIINIHFALLGLAPPSPLQVVQPSLPTRTLFEQGLNGKLHNSLVINNESQTKQCIKQTRNTLPSSSPATLVAAIIRKLHCLWPHPIYVRPLCPHQTLALQLWFPGQRRRNTFLTNTYPSLVLAIKNQSLPRKKVSMTIMNFCLLWHPLGNA